MKRKFTIQIEGEGLDGGLTALTISADGTLSQEDLANVFLQLGEQLRFGPDQWYALAALGASGKTVVGRIAEKYSIGGIMPVGPSSGADAPPSPQGEGFSR